MLLYLLCVILLIEAALLLIPLAVALIYGESALPFLITIGILAVISLPGILQKPKNTKKQQPKNTTFLLDSITTNQLYPLLLNSAHTTAVAMATFRLSAHSEPSG